MELSKEMTNLLQTEQAIPMPAKILPVNEEVSCTGPPALASGVVVKFPAPTAKWKNAPRAVAGQKKMRRGFFEHDNRNFKATKIINNENKRTDLFNCNNALVKAAVPGVVGGGGFGNGSVGTGPNGELVKMNSKARRAAKFREMKFLQRIMLSKEMNFAQLLPSLTPVSSGNGCCHCKCSNEVGGGTDLSSNGGDGLTVSPDNQQLMCSGGVTSVKISEKEVVNTCTVR